MSIQEIIAYVSSLSVVIPVVLYFVRIRHAPRYIHIIGIVVLVSGVSDLIGFVLARGQQSTVMLINAYYLILFFLLLWFYALMPYFKTHKFVITASVSLYIAALIMVTLFVQKFSEYQTLMWSLSGIMLTLFSIAYFLNLFSTQTANNFSLLWINSGILFYFSFNLALFIMSSYVLNMLDFELSAVIWSFHNLNNFIKNIMFAIGLAYQRKPQPGLSNS